ncbi:hypothetical protein GCM10010495_46130 [Kitasatospora herbaricolor]|uniref:hypothetical protein n=1 Tax=Kitasatospora herbaricolor TaxID=68217 RepID=UPI00174D8E29|nr:hypothetical protein [Kitasatospora herbaricolor]MDQ0312955.1 hypothetical protein [Kitasatospora herbaricolor]GGV25089.1 hypothetical protein GCM10010495_46130 [Kitasatospora herbaricolor]
MAQFVEVAAAVVMARPRLVAYLRAPAAPASTWPVEEWAGVCEPWRDGALRRRYREELVGAVEACDGWTDGDHAGLLRGLDDEDGSLTLGFDRAGGSLTIGFDLRVDFQLPSLIWAFSTLRGMAAFMADEDTGLVTVTAGWDDTPVLMHLGPNRSSFLDRSRDAAAWSRARDTEFDVRCAVSEAGTDADGSASGIIRRLLGG